MRGGLTGFADGTFLWFDTPERRKTFFISDPVINIQYVFFHLKSYQFDWENIDGLKDIRIGGIHGFNYGEAFQSAEKAGNIHLYRVNSDEINFIMLMGGRHHIVLCELESGYEVIHKIFTPEQIELFTHHPKPLRADPHHLLLPRNLPRSEKNLEIFNVGLKRLKENGSIEQYAAESRRWRIYPVTAGKSQEK